MDKDANTNSDTDTEKMSTEIPRFGYKISVK
jgi:hypothetical protein